jgi:hypothetical protein
MTIDLTDAQRSLLGTACTRNDRNIFPITSKLKGGAVGNVLKSLLKRQLIEEVPASDDHTVWRCDDGGKTLTLRLTHAGIAVLGGTVERTTESVESVTEPAVVSEVVAARKRGAAQDALLRLLRRPEGATIAEMQGATGWRPHSVRGALSGLIGKKLGHAVTSTKEERGRVYRILD